MCQKVDILKLQYKIKRFLKILTWVRSLLTSVVAVQNMPLRTNNLVMVKWLTDQMLN